MDTRDLPPAIRFDVWRAFWEPVVHVSTPRAGTTGFRGQAELRRLGRHVLLKFQADAADYRRARSEGLRDGLDHWLLALRLAEADGKPEELLLGALSHGFGLRKLGGHWCGVLIQPENLPQLAPVFATGRALALSSPAARMLGGMLPRIVASADEISAEDAPRLEAALSSMLSACLMGLETRPASTRQQLEAARRARVIALVDAALGEAELSPAMLVKRSGISRSELYRCFAPIGGIARVIQQRRLRQAYRDLMRADGPASVSRIGEAVGFYDPSSFTRAFRREFGCTPSEVLTRRQWQATEGAPGLAAALRGSY
ncbi:MAG: helix-turn-helix domain-containing protein [Roseomonas sp.]|nr:helix-turn-helix domain-containing protein [Roseomonas sp.]MCA3409214.1 helix-turn-helix domain-containing protein [Roseomonas sp.]